MGIPDEFLYEYAVVRYVPNIEREEFINIGLIMMCKRQKWMRGEVRLNLERLRSFDSGADLDSLSLQSSLFTRYDVPSNELPVEERYRWLSAVKSAVLQISPSHPGIISERKIGDTRNSEAIDMLDAEFERLFRELVV